MNKETENLINDIIDKKIAVLKEEMKDFRRWNPIDSVTDQFSPITGASKQIGFYGTTKKAKQTVTGAKGGNAALTSLLTALSTIGLITDSSS